MTQITDYSLGDEYTFATSSENISNIIDKMIRLAAKLTERFASDVIYDIEALREAVNGNMPYDKLMFFREHGVTTYATENFTGDTYASFVTCFTPIQIWRITHNPETKETKLMRVSVRKEWSYAGV